jgi:putative polyhydroxyalkanoate system protein
MSEIRIERPHALGLTEASRRVRDLEPKLKDRYGIKLDWSGDTANVKGSGVSGTIAVAEGKVDVQLKLGLLLRPMAGKIREAIDQQIEKALTS